MLHRSDQLHRDTMPDATGAFCTYKVSYKTFPHNVLRTFFKPRQDNSGGVFVCLNIFNNERWAGKGEVLCNQ